MQKDTSEIVEQLQLSADFQSFYQENKEYMVDKSDFLICYVKNNFGGAFKTMSYAEKKKHIKILNLSS